MDKGEKYMIKSGMLYLDICKKIKLSFLGTFALMVLLSTFFGIII